MCHKSESYDPLSQLSCVYSKTKSNLSNPSILGMDRKLFSPHSLDWPVLSILISKYTTHCQKSIRLISKRVEDDFIVLTGQYVSPVNTIFTNERIWPKE